MANNNIIKGDYISRDAGKEYLRAEFVYGESIARALNRVPPADVRPVVRGKWHKYIIGFVGSIPIKLGYDCTECGERLVVGKRRIKHYKFCPACGADMRDYLRGKWIPKDEYGSRRIETCPVCKKDTHYDRLDPSYDFCPNCGADMRGESRE